MKFSKRLIALDIFTLDHLIIVLIVVIVERDPLYCITPHGAFAF